MNKNQKIAIGCGVAGCLGLILLVIIIVVLGVLGYVALPGMSGSNRNYNYNSNSNENSNSNANSNTDSNSNTNSNSDSSSSSSSMTEDDKHKLFQAAGVTKDNDLILRVLRKIGFPNGSGEGYSDFIKNHFSWAMKNLEFIQSVNTPEKARAYVDGHIED
jgi:predicted metalloprotease